MSATMSEMTDAEQWRARGQMAEIDGYRLFYVDSGPPTADRGDRDEGDDIDGDRTLLVLHGYPTSSYDYVKVLPLLSERFRVVVHDHLGFGFSDKPAEYSYSLIEQADYALGLWRSLGIRAGHVLAHDYGTSVATELVARRNRGMEPVTLRSLTLCNGSMHIEMARLRLIQRLLRRPRIGPLVARLSSERVFRSNMRKIVADPASLSDDELRVMWQQLEAGGGRAVLSRVTRYLDERHRFWHRWIGALRTTDLPVNILWARRDPIAVEAMAHTLSGEIADSQLELLDDLGHFPMLEDPERWGRAVIALIASRQG